jgi:hypothetical protein
VIYLAYDLHITRANEWYESEGNGFSLEELKEYFSGKSGFNYSKVFSITGPVTVSIEGDFFIWASEDAELSFRYKQGRIIVSGANDDVIEKMKEIAAELCAKVQGDEDEIY